MKATTKLLRQIHPAFVRQGTVTSQAFRPTPKDDHRLSCDDGDRIAPEAAWRRYTGQGLASSGVQALTVAVCTSQGLLVEPDADPYPEHVSVDFTGLSNGQIERISKRLRDHASVSGWLFAP